jgi:CRP/FNR family cyclic AMP-dependent transcriptional regulator
MGETELGKRYREGELIVRQGEMGSCMYVLQEGEVEVLFRDGDKEVCLAVLAEGDFFGEMGLFEQEVRSASVRALGDVRALTIDKRTFLRKVHEDPSLAFNILQRMSHRVRELNAALIRLGSIPTGRRAVTRRPRRG